MRKALIVGINDYPNCSLFGCINDARSVAEILSNHEDGKKNFDVNLKENVERKGELLGLIDSLFRGNPEVALFYFSGHGYIDELGGYIVTPDFGPHDMGVSMCDILRYANESKAENKVIILDCCHAGAMGNMAFGNIGESIVGNGVTILTSSRDDESSMEIGGRGVFTSLLIEALDGGAANIQGDITPGSIYAFIDQALGAWEQRPLFKTNIQKFVSIRSVVPRISLDELRVLSECFASPYVEMKLDPSFEFTNTSDVQHKVIEPCAKEENVQIFKKLQKLESVGLIEPVGEEHMYFAAMNSKGCKLTTLGQYYWKLLLEKRI